VRRTALNSTSVERAPSSYKGAFVRGKSSYFPFRPGGLGELVLDKEEDGLQGTEGLEMAFERGLGEFCRYLGGTMRTHWCVGGIRTIPPGFTRGLDFGTVGDDEGLMEEEEELEVTPIYRPMLEYSSDGKATAVLVSSSDVLYRIRLMLDQNGRAPAVSAGPKLDSTIEELLPTRVRPSLPLCDSP
jgi:antiviral helicase SKI2